MQHLLEKGEVYTVFGGKTVVKRLLERPRRRWEENIKMDFQEVEWVRSRSIWHRIGTGGAFVNVVMNLRVP
jgi:hypothetical protein